MCADDSMHDTHWSLSGTDWTPFVYSISQYHMLNSTNLLCRPDPQWERQSIQAAVPSHKALKSVNAHDFKNQRLRRARVINHDAKQKQAEGRCCRCSRQSSTVLPPSVSPPSSSPHLQQLWFHSPSLPLSDYLKISSESFWKCISSIRL